MRHSIDSLATYYKGKTILVTGASGFLGHNLVAGISNFEAGVLRYTRDRGRLEAMRGKAIVQDIEGNYRDREMWEELVGRADIVFHLAAQTSLYQAEKYPAADYDDNVLPMQRLLEACRGTDRQPIVVFAATSTQCGLADELPVNEGIEDRPITFYDLHKLMAEQYLKYYIRRGYARGVSFRLANVYGPGPASGSVDRGILNLMIRKALRGEKLTLYGDGRHVRDYVYVEDVVAMFLKAPEKIEKLNGKHVLLGSGVGFTVREAIHLVAELVGKRRGKEVEVSAIEPPPALLPIESRHFVANTGLLTGLTGRDIQYSLREGIEKTIDYFLKIGADRRQ